ncbi:LamG-like jellyroll fold domain-containing protein, partial [Spirochaetota bacterium]
LNGDGIELRGEESSGVIRFNDSVQLDMTGSASIGKVLVTKEGAEKKVNLIKGKVRITIPDRASQVLSVQTANAMVFVRKGTLYISAGHQLTLVEVTGGEAKILRNTDGREITLSKGFYSIAAGGIPLIAKPIRSSESLRTLYLFSRKGDTIRDIAGIGVPVDLTIWDTASVRFTSSYLQIKRPVVISSDSTIKDVISSWRKNNAFSIEMWIGGDGSGEDGGVILEISSSVKSSNQKLVLFHSSTGISCILNDYAFNIEQPGSALHKEPVHIVYTYARGTCSMYLNGRKEKTSNFTIDLSEWKNRYRMYIANSITGNNPWTGDIYMLALYINALNGQEIEQNYKAGY